MSCSRGCAICKPAPTSAAACGNQHEKALVATRLMRLVTCPGSGRERNRERGMYSRREWSDFIVLRCTTRRRGSLWSILYLPCHCTYPVQHSPYLVQSCYCFASPVASKEHREAPQKSLPRPGDAEDPTRSILIIFFF